jgi:hypothetical protein
MMTSEERERLKLLCQQIQAETDPRKFSELVLELTLLAERTAVSSQNTSK